MEFAAPEIASAARPGQFVHIRAGDDHDPLLRRPLSLYDVDVYSGLITLLYRIVGRGTQLLSRYTVDQPLDVMGPLGRGFNLVQDKRVLLVGGGVGIAPLLFLARELQPLNRQVTVLHGAGNSQEICSRVRFSRLGISCLAATMDGSQGFKGLVTDLLEKTIDPADIDYVYTCGPNPMMAAVAGFAARHGLAGELSLEEYMACGVGACLGCAQKLKESDPSYVKICQDGPVFPLPVSNGNGPDFSAT
jgi:dihydroorotate dehydrogenase electron transfer subunit